MSIEKTFPQLSECGYELTSPRTPAYNCIAWALGDNQRWWENAPLPGYYWPEGEGDSTDDLLRIFMINGFEECDDDALEQDIEKVAIYVDVSGDYTHAARQLHDGWWTSKIGGWEDIRHRTLQGLVGSEYGIVRAIMKRRKGVTSGPEKTSQINENKKTASKRHSTE